MPDRPGESAYANPQPYAESDLERSALAGRIKVARGIATRYQQAGDGVRAARWQATVDRLLEHYNAAGDRAVTAAIDGEVQGE